MCVIYVCITQRIPQTIFLLRATQDYKYILVCNELVVLWMFLLKMLVTSFNGGPLFRSTEELEM